ncbi:MAG: hypothetical protein Q9Q13_00715 [Acidobacteriota bacterium]|nr:hypothetical protein [Acidobacteriota bacterium]
MSVCLALICACIPDALGAASQTEGYKPDADKHFMDNRRGYKKDHLYFSIGGAEVDAFNFHFMLNLTEQVGFGRPVDGGLTLQLGRVYNSDIYTDKVWQCAEQPCFSSDPKKHAYTYLSFPRRNAMGLGWEFHLGKIVKRDGGFCRDQTGCSTGGAPGQWAYIAPDGGSYVLFLEADGSYASRDGEFIRARYYSSGGGTGGDQSWWEVWLADGRVLELQHRVTGEKFREIDTSGGCATNRPYFIAGRPSTDPVGGTAENPIYEYDRQDIGYYVTRIRNREEIAGQLAAYIDVEYQEAPFDYVISRIKDSHDGESGAQRAIIVTIGLDPAATGFGHVEQVCFPGSPDGTGGHLSASCFQFEYERKELTIRGTEPRNGDPAPSWIQPVDLLRKVTTPEGYGIVYEYADSDPSITKFEHRERQRLGWPNGTHPLSLREARETDLAAVSSRMEKAHEGDRQWPLRLHDELPDLRCLLRRAFQEGSVRRW